MTQIKHFILNFVTNLNSVNILRCIIYLLKFDLILFLLYIFEKFKT